LSRVAFQEHVACGMWHVAYGMLACGIYNANANAFIIAAPPVPFKPKERPDLRPDVACNNVKHLRFLWAQTHNGKSLCVATTKTRLPSPAAATDATATAAD